ncbi:MAG TPA: hypothetical protein VEC11_01005 [Allosphingosinicella sp.]|nr:hypothetical protein [Allosphingosinicella sp.]
MQLSVRLASMVGLMLGICIPASAVACSIPLPPSPPPRAAAESEADFAARSERWYRDIAERQEQEARSYQAAREDQLWATAARVVLARVQRIGGTRVRGSEGQWYESPLVTLRPVRWLKGSGSARRVRVHYLSADSCLSGGAGDATDSQVGDLVLLFYRRGESIPQNILDSFARDRVVTQRSQNAFALAAGAGVP